MGMSASQARFLSITARIHDLEYQAQVIENAKLSLSHDANVAYDDYCEGINASKYQLKVVSGGEIDKVDLTYNSMVASANQPLHPMYIITDSATDNIYLPDAVITAMNGKIPETLDSFLEIVSTKYVYSAKALTPDEAKTELAKDGYTDYWTAVYYQLTGYTDKEGNVSNGHGFVAISNASANDREWIKKKIESGEAIINSMQSVTNDVDGVKVNIFAQTNAAVDTNISQTSDDLRISRAEADYENRMDNIDQKDKQLDLRLSRIENERNALKTEYDTVKDLIKKNIERSYKTFNA